MAFPWLIPVGSSFPTPYRQQPDVFVEALLSKVPASLGTEFVSWAFRPLADAGVLREGRVISISDITRSGADPDGNIQVSSVKVVVSDEDGAIRRRLAAGSPTEYFVNREMSVMELSSQGRIDGLDPVILFRGWITSVQPLPGRRAEIEIGSVLGALMSHMYVDQLVGTPIGDEQGPSLPDTSRGQIYPYVLGEGSDVGALDENGDRADVGVLPVVEGHTAVVPATNPEVTTYDSPVDFVAGVCADGAGNIGENTWFAGCAHQDGKAVTPLAFGQTGVTVEGSFTHAIDVYWNQQTVNGDSLAGVDGYWEWRWTGGSGAFHPFVNPDPGPGVQVAFKDIPNTVTGPHAVPGDGTSDFFTRFDAMPGNPWVPPESVTTLNPPVITDADTFGVPGTTTRYYQATATSQNGETTPSNVFAVVSCPDELDSLNGVDIDFTCDAGTDAIKMYGGLFDPPTELIASLPVAPAATSGTFRDDGSTQPQSVSPPQLNRAVVNLDGWTWMIAAEGALTGIPAVYGSDRAQNAPPKRVLQSDAFFGPDGELLAPGRPGWPHENNYIELGDIKQSGIYARGVILDHHRRGIVTITVNYCGQDADGTGTGLVVDGSMPQLRKFLEDKVLGDNPYWSNGDPIIDGPAFDKWQDASKDWMGNDDGYTGNLIVNEPTPLREILRRWAESTGGNLAETRQGQIRPFFIDDTQSPATAKYLRYPIEVSALTRQSLEWDQVKTREEASYAWSPSANDFLVKGVVFEDDAALEAYVPGGSTDNPDLRSRLTKKRDMYYVNDAAVAEDVCTRDLLRRSRRPELATVVTDQRGLQTEIGDLVWWAHPDRVSANASTSYEPTDTENLSLGMCIEHSINPMTMEVSITIRDLSTLHGFTEEDQFFLITVNEELMPIIASDSEDAPVVVL